MTRPGFEEPDRRLDQSKPSFSPSPPSLFFDVRYQKVIVLVVTVAS